ncbi:hypothetical protein [Saccharomonospora xinjiangensis]|uniref:hypothetical protein n=1 Tax=Saccharomonospora xinjiangensis TaxID=75294 RepID=UPI00106FC50A|nr:hypothetical protein [Saccharomonospora xinjiangensis]
MAADDELTWELGRKVGFMLLDAVEGDWVRIDLRCKVLSDVHDLALTVLMSDGSSPAVPLPEGIVEPVLRFREAFYEEGKGTWFSARWLLEPPGRLNLIHNVEWDPLWEPDVPASSWRADLERFPRDEEHMPEWLRAKLAEGPEGGEV